MELRRFGMEYLEIFLVPIDLSSNICGSRKNADYFAAPNILSLGSRRGPDALAASLVGRRLVVVLPGLRCGRVAVIGHTFVEIVPDFLCSPVLVTGRGIAGHTQRIGLLGQNITFLRDLDGDGRCA